MAPAHSAAVAVAVAAAAAVVVAAVVVAVAAAVAAVAVVVVAVAAAAVAGAVAGAGPVQLVFVPSGRSVLETVREWPEPDLALALVRVLAPELEPALYSIAVALEHVPVVPSRPLSHFGPELVPPSACTAQDSCLQPQPCSYKPERVVRSPSIVEGMMDGLAELALVVAVETALVEAA